MKRLYAESYPGERTRWDPGIVRRAAENGRSRGSARLEAGRLILFRPSLRSSYRFDWPRANFFTLALFSPRGVVRLPLGAAFLRAARFTFLRSSLSVMLLVFAMYS